jgi:hypothetical protein
MRPKSCGMCGKSLRGRMVACPVVCRSRHREALRAKRGAVTDYGIERRIVAELAKYRRLRWVA